MVLLVLCIAGANVANLLLAQAAERGKEMAVRLTLGATRGALQRLMLMESVILALGGGLFGFALSLWATQALSAFHLPAPVPLDLNIHADWRVLLYTFALSVGAGLLLGIAPAWAASHPILSSALKGEGGLGATGTALEFAQCADRRAGRDVGGVAVRDGIVFAEHAARVGNRYRISIARRADYSRSIRA